MLFIGCRSFPKIAREDYVGCSSIYSHHVTPTDVCREKLGEKSLGLWPQLKSFLQEILHGVLNLCFAIIASNALIIDVPTRNVEWFSTDILRKWDNSQIIQVALLKYTYPTSLSHETGTFKEEAVLYGKK